MEERSSSLSRQWKKRGLDQNLFERRGAGEGKKGAFPTDLEKERGGGGRRAVFDRQRGRKAEAVSYKVKEGGVEKRVNAKLNICSQKGGEGKKRALSFAHNEGDHILPYRTEKRKSEKRRT